ncbi:LPS translocon maturation chaperone LptM [Thioalkalivibrio sulfidiphilus]|uniref:LPS translocon maturation chaperone LptM n=1 Tax=Thioalkalivibrio sulfidiphilus TaxID=1033854 RepID=UPI00037C7412|nr:lipoprotein [Thioalkalivibrio sulfidiphilus]
MRICWSNLLMIAVVVALGSLSLLASCGQKGDLYLPEAEAAPVEETRNQSPRP